MSKGSTWKKSFIVLAFINTLIVVFLVAAYFIGKPPVKGALVPLNFLGKDVNLKFLVASGTGDVHQNDADGRGFRATMQSHDTQNRFDYTYMPENYVDADVIVYFLQDWEAALDIPDGKTALYSILTKEVSESPQTKYSTTRAITWDIPDKFKAKYPDSQRSIFVFLNFSLLERSCSEDQIAKEILEIFKVQETKTPEFNFSNLKECASRG